MSTLYSILDRPGALLLLLIALSLMIGQAAALVLSLKEKQSGRQTTAAALHLLAGFLFFVFLLNSYDIVSFPQTQGASINPESLPFSLSWLCYAFLEALFACFLMLQFRDYRRYKKSTVTPNAIRQTVDLLPEGICISDQNGTALLSNLTMDALCRELTGERPADVHRLWARLEADGEDQSGKRLIRTSRGEVWLFSRGAITADGKDYDRTSAVNVTERYHITEELREKNAQLQDIQHRMKEASALSSEMFVKQEEAAARTALHNELGQVLLMGRHYLEHSDSTNAALVALITKQMNRFLLGEGDAPDPNAGDELQQAVHMAGSIGVTVEMTGEAPKKLHSLLAAAIRECAANTIKHAEGDRLFVEITGNAGERRITITNNGKPPKSPIAESGGLLSLRRGVEEAGGQMIVQSLPAFSLTLRFMNA
jgi:two-component sensor histidine kinase